MAQYEEFTIDQGADVTSSDSDTTTFTSLVTNASGGIAYLTLTNSQTNALKPGRYVYDVELSFQDSDLNTITERVLEGRIQVTPSVTK